MPLLSGGEARGLPGVVVARVMFQRAGFGHPMDDVIITGYDSRGSLATLELQAKRTIAFTASDSVFADVVVLACRAVAKPEFSTTRYELAVALARTSTKIEQHVQDVLRWAREYQGAEDFFRRLNQAGAAHQGMRDFVTAFRGHMQTAGAAHDDAAVWLLLSRFQVLAFDFEQPGSVCAQLARERCALLLASQAIGRSAELWDSLQQIALQVDAAGGDLDANALRERLTSERSFSLAGDRRLHAARERIAEVAENALTAIETRVHGAVIDRRDLVAAALSALERGRYLEIRGAGGVGKSGVLKELALRVGVESRIVVVVPHRVPGGGWAALEAQLGCHASARDFLTDLAGDGGGTLFVDGIDRFDDASQRATVVDLISAAAQVRGFSVVATARTDFDADARAWLPTRALQELGEAPPLVIDELGDDEVNWLRDADPALAALLRTGHPAQKLVRNLYRLDRLARSAMGEAMAPFSETQMASQWWTTGDSAQAAGRLERFRVLHSLAMHSLASSAPMDSSAAPAEAISALAESGTLHLRGAVRIELAHDVLRDWAVGCLLREEPEHLSTLSLNDPVPQRLVRGVEIAARLHAELGKDETAWKTLLDAISTPQAHGSWRRTVLLALVRSERAEDALTRCFPTLASNNGEVLADLVRAVITVDSQPAAPLWAALGADTSKLTNDFVAPVGAAWLNLIAWSLSQGDRLPNGAVPQLVNLYNRWCTVFAGQDVMSPLLVARLYSWLIEVQAKNHPRVSGSREYMAARRAPGLSMTTAQESDLRTAFLSWCKLRPSDIESYLHLVADHPYRHVLFRPLLTFLGTAPQAAPQAVADLFLRALPEGDDDAEDRRSSIRDTFSAWDLEYFPPSPARAPFLDLLLSNKEQGLRLVHGVVAHAIRRRTQGREPGQDSIDVPFPSGKRSFPWLRSYVWSRAHQSSNIVASALMALEAWAHLRIERGEPAQAVIDDLLRPEVCPAAYLLVAVDVMLSHWPKTRGCIWPFAASAALLAMDRERYGHDLIISAAPFTAWVHHEPFGAVRLENLLQRPSRSTALDAVLFEFGFNGPPDVREAMQQALRIEAEQIGQPDVDSRGMADPRFAAMCALNQLDPTNYVQRGDDEEGQTIEYVPPAEEARLLGTYQTQAHRGNAEIVIRTRFMRALVEPPCSSQLLEDGVRWAQSDPSTSSAQSDADDAQWISRTQLIVAALLMRDGSPEQKVAYGTWAREKLVEAADREGFDDAGFAKQMPYNTMAIAAVGLLAAYRDDSDLADLPRLLHLAANRTTGMVTVLHAEIAAQRSLLPTLVRSLVRIGLSSAIYAVPQREDDPFKGVDDYVARQREMDAALKEAERTRLKAAVAAELAWLSGEGSEPSWPELPNPRPPKGRFTISLGASRPRPGQRPTPSRTFALDDAAAAEWLSLAVALWRAACPALLRALVKHCWLWTAGANGVGCGPDEEPSERAFAWNDAYFAAALAAAVAIDDASVEEYVLQPLAQLPEERFVDAAEAVLHALDRLWLNDGAVSDSVAVSIREAIARRLVTTRGWQHLASEVSDRTEMHLAGAVAAVFMGEHAMGKGPKCYVLPPGASRAELLLSLLTELTEHASGSTFVALAFLGLMEVGPNASRLAFMGRAVTAWWRMQGANAEFWIDHGVGRRVCEWIDTVVLAGSAPPAVLNSADLIGISDVLVRCGTPMGAALEERLDARRKYAAG
ncbi:hypothetical protein [Variovorax sp. dw_308]|uniref:hypothetical protein n=1 Tax=Variovorax sp. dw_308 TaxID=2721546 RepID=UPI00210B83B8|nr:hypothetical protein [Variovorax sp. dw_308]